jgi:hypothetical protein
MAFFIRREADDWFKELQKNELIRTQFDLYYLFFLKGISKLDRNPKMKSSDALKELIEYFPSEYDGSKNIIVGLLVNTELKRLGIPFDHKENVQKKYNKIVEPESQSKLTSKGFVLMNDYASKGYELFNQELGNKSASLAPEFLINAFRNLNEEFQDNYN